MGGLTVQNSGNPCGDLVDLTQTRNPAKLPLGMVVSDQGRRLLVVLHQAGSEAFLVVVGATLEI